MQGQLKILKNTNLAYCEINDQSKFSESAIFKCFYLIQTSLDLWH